MRNFVLMAIRHGYRIWETTEFRYQVEGRVFDSFGEACRYVDSIA